MTGIEEIKASEWGTLIKQLNIEKKKYIILNGRDGSCIQVYAVVKEYRLCQ